MSWIYLYTLVVLISSINALTCDDIMEMPEDRNITMLDLQKTLPKEIVQCLVHLGKNKLPADEMNYIWKTIVQFYDGVNNIPDKDLISLHWITPAVEPQDYYNITLSSIDVIQNFGLDYRLSHAQLSAIAESVKENFASKDPEDYSYYDLIALRQILCAFNKTDIERIHPSAYREAALVIGKLQRCDPDVMKGFATLAVQPKAFGHVSTWSDNTAETVGIVLNYLPVEFRRKFKTFAPVPTINSNNASI